MTGIMYFMRSGAIILNVHIKGKKIEFVTPAWLMHEVLLRKRNFGHFNPTSDLEKYKLLKESKDG